MLDGPSLGEQQSECAPTSSSCSWKIDTPTQGWARARFTISSNVGTGREQVAYAVLEKSDKPTIRGKVFRFVCTDRQSPECAEEGIGNVTVRARRIGKLQKSSSAKTLSDGTYEISLKKKGRYRVSVRTRGRSFVPRSKRVKVPNGEVNDVDFFSEWSKKVSSFFSAS